MMVVQRKKQWWDEGYDDDVFNEAQVQAHYNMTLSKTTSGDHSVHDYQFSPGTTQTPEQLQAQAKAHVQLQKLAGRQEQETLEGEASETCDNSPLSECGVCGEELDEDMVFCFQCGVKRSGPACAVLSWYFKLFSTSAATCFSFSCPPVYFQGK